MPGEEARVSNLCQCSLTNVAHLVFVGGLKGCKLRMWIQQQEVDLCHKGSLLRTVIPYTRVNKRNRLRSAYCLLSAYFFPGFAPG